MKTKFGLIVLLSVTAFSNLLASEGIHISFDAPYLKTAPGQLIIDYFDSSGSWQGYGYFTADCIQEDDGTGGYLYFSGNNSSDISFNDWVEIPDTSLVNIGTSNFNVMFEIKTTSQKANNTILDKRSSVGGNGYHITILNGKPLLQISSSVNGWANYWATSSNAKVNDGLWHSVQFLVDRDNAQGGKIFVDNVLVLTFDPTEFNGDYIYSSQNLYLGRHLFTGRSNFEGSLDELTITKW